MGKHNSALAEQKRVGPLFLVILSATALAFLVSFRILSTPASLIRGTLLAFLVLCILGMKTSILEGLRKPSSLLVKIMALIFASVTLIRILIHFFEVLDLWIIKNKIELPWSLVLIHGVLVLIGLCAFWAVYLLYAWLFNQVKETGWGFFNSLSRVEMIALIGGTSVLVILMLVFFNLSSAFTSPIYLGKILPFDVVYISDSPNHLITDVFFNIGARENDLRQPLFALTTMPLANLAWMGSLLLFFIPQSYVYLLQGFQIFFLMITMILLSRLIKVKGIDQALFLGLALSSFPVLLFTVMIEQYILALFWLILWITAIQHQHKDKVLLFILATGNMLTTGFLFPLLTKAKAFKPWFGTLWWDFMGLIAALLVFGQDHLFYFILAPVQKMESIAPLFRTFEDKMLQYLTFVASCFVAPASSANFEFLAYPSYQQTVITQPSLIGILLILMALIGFMLHRKSPFAKIALTWIGCSFLVLGLVGWGTLENGLILYVLYFGWAYLVLIVMGGNTLMKPWPRLKIGVWMTVIGTILVINSLALLDLLRFCIDYYPAR